MNIKLARGDPTTRTTTTTTMRTSATRTSFGECVEAIQCNERVFSAEWNTNCALTSSPVPPRRTSHPRYSRLPPPPPTLGTYRHIRGVGFGFALEMRVCFNAANVSVGIYPADSPLPPSPLSSHRSFSPSLSFSLDHPSRGRGLPVVLVALSSGGTFSRCDPARGSEARAGRHRLRLLPGGRTRAT